MSLKNYFSESDHPDKKEFDDLLDRLYFHPEQFSSIVEIRTGRYFHISPSFFNITGYTVSELEAKGISFFPEYVHPEDALQALAIQAESLQQVFKSGFDPEQPNVAEIPARMRRPDGTYIKTMAIVMAMAYLPNGLFDFTLGTGYATTVDETENTYKRKEAIELLTRTKKLYRTIYPQPTLKILAKELPTQIIVEKDPKHTLTSKEKEILQMLARGASSKDIGLLLGISENTVESHRRNMLKKYDSKNIAELVKKLSKLYWLE